MRASAAAGLTTFRSPKSVITRFVARRTLRSATVWALIFGAYVASKAVGFVKAYPTAVERAKITHSFTNNIGLNALVGTPHKIDTVPGYVAWNCLLVLTIIGSIWAFLLATKYFRGEEDAGRSEILLTGQTTQRRAAINTLVGLGASVLLLFLISAAEFVAVGQMHDIGMSTTGSLFLALACTSGAAMFLAIGAFTSQLMPTRGRASSVAAIVFGVSFLVRAMADSTTMHWLLNISPIGWVERLQPLADSQPIWLLPIFGTVAVLTGATVWLAGRRDLGASIIADNDSAKPRTTLLNSPFAAALRLNRGAIIGWLIAVGFMGAFYGLLTNAAVQAFNQAGAAEKTFNRIEHSSTGALSSLFLGFVFFILLPIIMAYVASAMGRVRADEADGYVDNFLVRPVSRYRWLAGRVALIAGVSVAACLVGGLCTWAGQISQHTGVSFHALLLAGLNIIAPVFLTLGIAVLALGYIPRLTTLVAYSVIGWSFLISMMSSGINLSHWILDTSLLHQMALAPAANPDWKTNGVMAALGLLLCTIGAVRFNSRDLQSE